MWMILTGNGGKAMDDEISAVSHNKLSAYCCAYWYDCLQDLVYLYEVPVHHRPGLLEARQTRQHPPSAQTGRSLLRRLGTGVVGVTSGIGDRSASVHVHQSGPLVLLAACSISL